MIDIDFRYSKGAKELKGKDPLAFKKIEDAVSLARVAATPRKTTAKRALLLFLTLTSTKRG